MNDHQLNQEGRQQWDNKAQFWDELHGSDGNTFHQTLVSPSVERLLDLQAGEQVLDIGCGTGVLARELAELGAIVTATDFSTEMIRIARKHGQTSGEPITYQTVDATDETALLALGKASYDAITCTMALMDMPVIEPLFRAVSQLLKPNGRFVFAITHPAFNSNNPIFIMEQGDDGGTLYTKKGVKLFAYLDMPPVKGVGAKDEPNPHYYYHRSLQDLLTPAFDAGLIMDALDEPAFPANDSIKRLTWAAFPQFPPVLTVRLRVK